MYSYKFETYSILNKIMSTVSDFPNVSRREHKPYYLEMWKFEKIVIFANWVRGRSDATALCMKMSGVQSK